MPRSGRDASTRTFAPPTSPQATGTPSHGSALPQRPKPMSTYGLPSSRRARFLAATSLAIAREWRGVEAVGRQVHDVADVVDDSVAHDVVGGEEHSPAGSGLVREVDELRRDDHRPHLQQAEPERRGSAAGRASRRTRSRPVRRPPSRRARGATSNRSLSGKLLVDEQRREVDDAGALRLRARARDGPRRRPRWTRSSAACRPLRPPERAADEVLGLAHRVVGWRLSHVHRPELGLRGLEQVGGAKRRAPTRAGWAGE